MDSLLFGFIDNAVLILGAITGLSVERYLPVRLQAGLGGVIGAGLGNAISDFLAGFAVDPLFAAGTAAGCLAALPLIAIAFVRPRRA